MGNRRLYHITDYQNLFSILQTGYLSAHSLVLSKQIPYADIAHKSIQDKRSWTTVPTPPYGLLHDYVPFYFAPRSPMLFAIARGYVENYKRGQNGIIYLVTRTDKIQQAGKKFVFTDGHAIMNWTEFLMTYITLIGWIGRL